MRSNDDDRSRRYPSDARAQTGSRTGGGREGSGGREIGSSSGAGAGGGNGFRRQSDRDRDREYDRDYRDRGDRDRDRDRGGGSGSGGESRERCFGIVMTAKETFGFILPYLGEEHIFFSFRDGPADPPEIGEEVEYHVRQGPKGPAAVNVRRLDSAKIKLAPPPTPLPSETTEKGVKRYRGVISWDADPYKNTPGVLTLSNPQNTQVPTTISFLSNDVTKTANIRRVNKGDEVEFDLYVIPGTQYARAKDLVMFRSKRDRQIAEQIQLFTKAGVLPEHGVIDSIKSDYGFIKSCDRPDQLFFRLDDIMDETTRPNENDEVAFYVISEHTRGKMSDRAVHISFLPHGTVFFEKLITNDVLAYVSSEPKVSTSSRQEEQPGMLRLVTPIEYDQDVLVGGSSKGIIKTITEVELWGRCMPDFLASTLRIGDILKIDVSLYRPEKLIFGRNIRVEKYRSLGRMFGVVSEVKEGRGYGFIKCLYGGVDTYFKTNEVLRSNQENAPALTSGNQFMDERSVKISQPVSYECSVDEVSGGEYKLRSVRVVAENTNFERKSLFIANVKGTVVKEPKKDFPGVLTLIEGQTRDERSVSLPTHQEELRYGYEDIHKGIEEIASNPDLKEVTLEYVLPRQRFAIHELIRSYFTGIAHQTIVDTKMAAASAYIGKGQKIRLWKISDPVDFARWNEEDNLRNGHGAKSNTEGDLEDNDVDVEGEEVNQKPSKSVSNRIYFLKIDLSDSNDTSFGSVRAGAIVDFDLCVDKLNCSKVASNVRVSDELVSDGLWPQLGIIEYVRPSEGNSSSSTSGYIRSIPSDEKLPWITLAPLSIGTQVCFELRNRGGIRYANLVTPLTANPASLSGRILCSPCSETLLSGTCVGMVVSETVNGEDGVLSVYPFDFFDCPELFKKFVDLPEAIMKVVEKRREIKVGHSDEPIWEKHRPDEIEESKSSSLVIEPKKVPPANGVPVYYPSISPYLIPLSGEFDPSICSPGKIINFQSVVNWSVKRGPISILNPQPSSRTICDLVPPSSVDSLTPVTPLTALLSKSLRQVGTIVRLTINVGNGIELAEVNSRDGVLFYCESKELRRCAGSTIHVGDEIEFMPAIISLDRQSTFPLSLPSEIRIAVQPSLLRSISTLQKKKTPVTSLNTKTSDGPKPTFKSPITMAAGPPTDLDRGFPAGWRGEQFKQALPSPIPWLSSLLSHLLEEGVC